MRSVIRYSVCVQLPDPDKWHVVASCESPQIAAEVVRCLLTAWGEEPKTVKVEIRIEYLES